MVDPGSRERLRLLPIAAAQPSALAARDKKAAPLTLDPSDNVATAFGTIARGCIGHLLGNQNRVSERGSGKGIHQMRVTLRRLRATLALFDGLFGREMQAELKPNCAGSRASWLLPMTGTFS